MDNEATTAQEPTYKCETCEDSHKVMLTLTGASGGVNKEVPCPDCQQGVKLATSNGVPVDLDDFRAEYDQRIKNVALLALVGVGLGFLAVIMKENGDMWHHAVKEVTE